MMAEPLFKGAATASGSGVTKASQMKFCDIRMRLTEVALMTTKHELKVFINFATIQEIFSHSSTYDRPSQYCPFRL